MDLDRSWALLQNVMDAQRFADTKAGAVLAANGILGSLAIPMLAAAHDQKPAQFALTCLSIVALAVSTGFCLRTVIPRDTMARPPSLIYFGDIAHRFAGDDVGYTEAHLGLVGDPVLLATEISQQIWTNSLIAQRKFVSSAWSIRLLAVGLVLAGTALGVGGMGW